MFFAGRLPKLPNDKETQEEERSLMLPESKNGQGKSPDDYNVNVLFVKLQPVTKLCFTKLDRHG